MPFKTSTTAARVRGALTIVLLLLPALAGAQKNVLYDMKTIPGGDLQFRTLIHLEYRSELAPPVIMIPGFGLEGTTFQRRVGGEPGWGKLLKERGYSAWMLDNVAVGQAEPPQTRDLGLMLKWGLFGAYQLGLANQSALAILHGQGAGLGLRGMSFDTKYTDAMVLIDPIGPQGAQDMMPFEPEVLLERRFDPNHRWRTWGFGPERGVVHEGLDLSAARAESLYARYDSEQPPYWAGLLTTIDADYEVREAINLAGIPVLVVRTPAADAEQVAREESVVRWMNERGMIVETLDLNEDDELRHTSGLPWAGDLAPRVLDEIMTWYEGLDGMRPPVGR